MITGNTLWDQRRSNEIREECKTDDMVRWTRARRYYWNEHVSRMENHRHRQKLKSSFQQTTKTVSQEVEGQLAK